jgi:hypothetical protein
MGMVPVAIGDESAEVVVPREVHDVVDIQLGEARQHGRRGHVGPGDLAGV